MFVYETEEIIDKLRTYMGSAEQSTQSSTTIAFMDFSNMGTLTSLLYIIVAGSMLGVVLQVLYKAV
jgi:lipid-A-disaccharide synthase-like uncharacterized protein